MTYIDREGREQYPVMGCYGIGVGRLAALRRPKRNDRFPRFMERAQNGR